MKIIKLIAFEVLAISVLTFGYCEVNKIVNTDNSIPVITGPKDVLEVSCNYSEKDL